MAEEKTAALPMGTLTVAAGETAAEEEEEEEEEEEAMEETGKCE